MTAKLLANKITRCKNELVFKLTRISRATPDLFFARSGKGKYLLFNALYHLVNTKFIAFIAVFKANFVAYGFFLANKREKCGKVREKANSAK